MSNNKIFIADQKRFEDYYSGKMSDADKHKLEVEALEDPILQEMLDGYAFVDKNKFKQHLSDIEDTITEKNRQPLIVRMPMYLKIAAVICLIGAGAIIFSIIKNYQDKLNAPTITAHHQQIQPKASTDTEGKYALSYKDLKNMHQFKGIILDSAQHPLRRITLTSIKNDSLTVTRQTGEFVLFARDSVLNIKINGFGHRPYLLKSNSYNKIIAGR